MFATKASSEVLKLFESSKSGLKESEIETRRKDFGWNEIPEKKRSLILLFLEQFQDIFVYILLVALGLSIIEPFLNDDTIRLASFSEAIAISAIVLLNAVLGFVQEYKAEEAIKLLKKLAANSVRVRRDSHEMHIPSREILPGDIIIIEAGDKISADGRLIHVSHLEVNESSFTGEMLPVLKTADTLSGELELAEQRNFVFAGTIVTRGSGEYVVTAIGRETELGKIAKLVDEIRLPDTPLQRRLHRLSKHLGLIVLGFALVLVIMSLLRHESLTQSILMGVSLAVSSVPEGLPAVVTACLAIGVRRMTKTNVLVRRLESLETLGSVTVICTDKTGTVTENRMSVSETWLFRGEVEEEKKLLLQIAAACNRAELPDIGDPTEIGLLHFATKHGIERLPIDEEEVPFSAEEKYMQTRHGDQVFLKGAPEKIAMMISEEESLPMLTESDRMAAGGLRVLACAIKKDSHVHAIGLIAMEDPARPGVKEAIDEAKRAGIRTIMITGDHLLTAKAIAQKVGIVGDVLEAKELNNMPQQELMRRVRTTSVFARVSPEHKVMILEALKQNGEIVAMSGDGVNDAPALKGAHVGVAMGKNGTDVAREAASIVLTDDHYATIVRAVREGRHIYDNIRKFILCLLQLNFYELIFFMAAILLGLPIPYLPIHILWINLMTDGLPALSLAMEPEEPNIMNRPPRSPTEHVFSGQLVRLILATLLPFIIVLTLYMWLLDMNLPMEKIRTMIFTFAIFFELFFVFTVRSSRPLLSIGLFSNLWIWPAVTIPIVLHLVLLHSPLRDVFGLTTLMPKEWMLILLLSSSGLILFEFGKTIQQLFPGFNRSAKEKLLYA